MKGVKILYELLTELFRDEPDKYGYAPLQCQTFSKAAIFRKKQMGPRMKFFGSVKFLNTHFYIESFSRKPSALLLQFY